MIFERLKFWKKDIITFYCPPDLEGVIPEPRASSKYLPDWFKNLPPQIKGESPPRDIFGNYGMTAKMCLPLLDGMSLGYTIPLCGDVRVISNHDNSKIRAIHGRIKDKDNFKLIDYHHYEQVGGKNVVTQNQGDILKFNNPWIIKTAPGWSTLFIPTLNHFNAPFTPFSAIVDTDVYFREVHFPVIWNVPNADMTLSSGTPIITAIPFKRKAFPRKPIIKKISEKVFHEYCKTEKIQDLRSHYYTYELREKR